MNCIHYACKGFNSVWISALFSQLWIWICVRTGCNLISIISKVAFSYSAGRYTPIRLDKARFLGGSDMITRKWGHLNVGHAPPNEREIRSTTKVFLIKLCSPDLDLLYEFSQLQKILVAGLSRSNCPNLPLRVNLSSCKFH